MHLRFVFHSIILFDSSSNKKKTKKETHNSCLPSRAMVVFIAVALPPRCRHRVIYIAFDRLRSFFYIANKTAMNCGGTIESILRLNCDGPFVNGSQALFYFTFANPIWTPFYFCPLCLRVCVGVWLYTKYEWITSLVNTLDFFFAAAISVVAIFHRRRRWICLEIGHRTCVMCIAKLSWESVFIPLYICLKPHV